MVHFLYQAAKFRVNLLDGNNYLLYARRMEDILMDKHYWSIVSEVAENKSGITEDA